MQVPDILLDTLQFLELNELEKCRYVSRQWNKMFKDYSGMYLEQKRRVHEVNIKINQYEYTDVGFTFI